MSMSFLCPTVLMFWHVLKLTHSNFVCFYLFMYIMTKSCTIFDFILTARKKNTDKNLFIDIVSSTEFKV
jgi:hypothetical protein